MAAVAHSFGGIGLSGRRIKLCMPVFKMNEMMPKLAVFSSDKRQLYRNCGTIISYASELSAGVHS